VYTTYLSSECLIKRSTMKVLASPLSTPYKDKVTSITSVVRRLRGGSQGFLVEVLQHHSAERIDVECAQIQRCDSGHAPYASVPAPALRLKSDYRADGNGRLPGWLRGAPRAAPSAYRLARSRLIISVPGCKRSQAARLSADRSGSKSIGVCLFEVDQNGPIALSFSPGPVVNPTTLTP
jgi:hypothetical protein